MSFFSELGAQSKNEAADRLDKGQGIKGKLAPLKNPNRKIGGELPGVIRRGRIKALPEGFEETHADDRLVAFHEGEPESNQVARPVIGIPEDRLPVFAKATGDELVRLAKSMGVA